jgi:hypothetical protein
MPHVVEAKIMDEICDLAGASRVNIGPQCAHCVVDRVGIPLLQSLEQRCDIIGHAAVPCRRDRRTVTGVLV